MVRIERFSDPDQDSNNHRPCELVLVGFPIKVLEHLCEKKVLGLNTPSSNSTKSNAFKSWAL